MKNLNLKVKYYVLVYPEDKMAKAYELKEKFEKMPLNSKYTFNLECEVSVDFDEIFKRLSIIS